jgi:hypothetical protein
MRSSRPNVFPRTPRLRDASRRPSIDRSAPTTADGATNRRLQRPRPRFPDDRPRPITRSATGPPTALDDSADPAHQRIGRTEARTAGSQLSRRQRRGSHPDSALAIDSDESAPAVRETFASARGRAVACRATPAACREASRRSHRRIGCTRRREIAASACPTGAERAPGPHGGIETCAPLRAPTTSTAMLNARDRERPRPGAVRRRLGKRVLRSEDRTRAHEWTFVLARERAGEKRHSSGSRKAEIFWRVGRFSRKRS